MRPTTASRGRDPSGLVRPRPPQADHYYLRHSAALRGAPGKERRAGIAQRSEGASGYGSDRCMAREAVEASNAGRSPTAQADVGRRSTREPILTTSPQASRPPNTHALGIRRPAGGGLGSDWWRGVQVPERDPSERSSGKPAGRRRPAASACDWDLLRPSTASGDLALREISW